MGRALLGLLPWWALAAIGGVLLVWVGARVEQHGADRIQARWDQAEQARQALEREQLREDARLGGQAGMNHEQDKQALERVLRKTKGALDDALKRAATCGPTAGDVVVPGALGVRLNEVSRARAAGSAASEPVGGV